ncbi:hypothetical protein [Grimontia marina]|nr:hypothetical protein [Grimontia marina]
MMINPCAVRSANKCVLDASHHFFSSTRQGLLLTPLVAFGLTFQVHAEESDLQDMSDPLAVYTQAGVGVTNNGLNFKMGMTYDTGIDTTMGMSIIELKGLLGDFLHLGGDDSFDSVRFRNFGLDTQTGWGSQIDISWDFDNSLGSASYSKIRALPAMGALQLYPLAGAGLTVSDTAEIRGNELPIGSVGYAIPSSYLVVGSYSKLTLTDDIWLNYNPMYVNTLNDNSYMKGVMDGWHHEVAASYQINPRQNVRLFGNFSDSDIAGSTRDWRLEFNHQF